MNYLLLVYMFFCHWLFDFVLQLDGDKKHIGWKTLLFHTIMYSGMMGWAYFLTGNNGCGDIDEASTFAGVTFLAHTITDYFTSRWNHKQLQAKKYKLWINSIGFDQFLHHAQILLTIAILDK